MRGGLTDPKPASSEARNKTGKATPPTTKSKNEDPPVACPDAEKVFKNACEDFRRGLTDEEKKKFPKFKSAEKMLECISNEYADHPIHASRFTRCCMRIRRFTESLEPFFPVVGIFVQSHPEYAGIAWGALRLIFQLGSQHVHFLEKVARMFEDIAKELPLYSHFSSLLMENLTSSSKQSFEAYNRLAQALGYVFTDILRFCHEVYRIFSKRRSSRFHALFLRHTCWKPFDNRFAEFLERFRAHKQLLVGSTIVTALTQLLDDKYIRSLQNCDPKKSTGTDEDALLRARVHEIIQWIDAEGWEESLQNTLDGRKPGTCQYLSSEPLYCRWYDEFTQPATLHAGTRKAMLLIESKPGYGKTHLCASVIQELQLRQKNQAQLGDPTEASNPVLFFFFRQKQSGKTSLIDCLRALLSQLLNVFRHNKQAIDMASLLKYDSKGQYKATREEVEILLTFLFTQLQHAIIVLDGLEECDEPSKLVSYLDNLTIGSTSPTTLRVMCFSRPQVIRIKSVLRSFEWKRALHLQRQNLSDIRSYFATEFLDLFDEGLLPTTEDCESITDDATSHSNSMFLWCNLLIAYLRSDGLTMRDRLDAVRNLVYLEGLDSLCLRILKNLENHQGKARTTIKKMFQWTLFSRRPLSLQVLRTAISLPATVGSSWDPKFDEIHDLDKAIYKMSGALLEVDDHDTVRFIHGSVSDCLKGYFSDEEHSNARTLPTWLNFSPIQSYRAIAHSCLNYFNQCIPAGQISGQAQSITFDRTNQERKFPLVKLFVQDWVWYTSKALDPCGWSSDKGDVESLKVLFEELSQFLGSRDKTTMWIEVSYLFEIEPRLGSLSSQVVELYSYLQALSNDYNALKALGASLHQFSADLNLLNQEWGQTLMSEPHEIWHPSVSTFTESDFWFRTKDGKATSLSSKFQDGRASAVIQSQIALDGLEIGVVKLNASSLMLLKEQLTKKLCYSADWSVTYEIWSLQTKKLLQNVSFQLPKRDIERLLSNHVNVNDVRLQLDQMYFDMPVSISGDLKTILVLEYLFVAQQQVPNSPNSPFDLEPTCSTTIDILSISALAGSRHYTFEALLSSSGQELLILRPSLENGRRSGIGSTHWDLEAFCGPYKGAALDAPTSSIRIARPELPTKLEDLHLFSEYVAFHPFLRILVVSTCRSLLIWRFDSPDVVPLQIYNQPIKQPRFSECGGYLHGTLNGRFKSGFMVLDMKQWVQKLMIDQPKATTNTLASNVSKNLARCMSTEMFDVSSRTVQDSGTLRFEKSCDGAFQVSQLNHFRAEGAIVLHTLRSDGIAKSEVLTRLPESLELNDAVIVPSGEDESVIRLVLKPPRRPMSCFDQVHGTSSGCPLVVERTKCSIEAINVSTRGCIDGGLGRQFLLKGSRGAEAETAGQSRKRQKISPAEDVTCTELE